MSRRGWWRRTGMVLGSLAVLAGALTVPVSASAASADQAQLAAQPPEQLPGGVGDGSFASSCLRTNATGPDTGVIGARAWRGPMGRVVRIVIPWDIATNPHLVKERDCFEQYAADAKSDRVMLDVSLGYDGPPPSLAVYTTAVTDLARSKVAGDVPYLSAWNEPDNPTYLPVRNPALLGAQFYQAAWRAFARYHVTMLAGDFASGVSRSFFETYANHLGKPWPNLWSIHPSTDVTNFEYDMLAGQTARRAGNNAAAISKVRQLAIYLQQRGAGNRIWINEIFVEHKADRCPPPGIRVDGLTNASCEKHKDDPAYLDRLPSFSTRIQDDAARFIDGSLLTGLAGFLQQHRLPLLTRYVYLRAWSYPTDEQLPNAAVLEVHFNTSLYCTLSQACRR